MEVLTCIIKATCFGKRKVILRFQCLFVRISKLNKTNLGDKSQFDKKTIFKKDCSKIYDHKKRNSMKGNSQYCKKALG